MADYKKKISTECVEKTVENSNNLYKNINDLLLQTNSFEFYKKFQSIMMDYFKPTYNDISLISQDMNFVGNLNDERIKRYKVLNHVFNLLGCSRYIPDAFFNTVEFDEDSPFREELQTFWRLTTRKTELKQILGFPLCVYTNKTYQSLLKKDKKYYLYFLKNPTKHTTSFFTEINKTENFFSEIFQKILIFHHLYQNGITSQNFIFEQIENKTPIKMTFKVMDLLFTVPVRNIIILSPKTHLIFSSVVQPREYFNNLEEADIRALNNVNADSFPEFLITNFPQFFQKSIYNSRNLAVMADVSTTTIFPLVGRLYLVKRNNSRNVVYCIILNKNTTHATLLYLFDSTIPNTLSLSTQSYNLSELSNFIFYEPNFIFDDAVTNYFIGSKN